MGVRPRQLSALFRQYFAPSSEAAGITADSDEAGHRPQAIDCGEAGLKKSSPCRNHSQGEGVYCSHVDWGAAASIGFGPLHPIGGFEATPCYSKAGVRCAPAENNFTSAGINRRETVSTLCGRRGRLAAPVSHPLHPHNERPGRNNPKEFVSVRVAANALESGLHWNPSPDWVIPLPTWAGLLCLRLEGRPRPLGGLGG